MNKFENSINLLTIRPSQIERYYNTGLYGSALFLSLAQWGLYGGIAFLVLWVYVQYLQPDRPELRQLVRRSNGQFLHITEQKMSIDWALLGSSLSTPCFCILHFQNLRNGSKMKLTVWKDSLSESQFRALRGYLKWGRWNVRQDKK